MSLSDTPSTANLIPESGSLEALCVRIDGTEFLVPIELTENVVEWQDPSTVPRTGEGVHGITDLRGEITVILNARPYLYTEDADEEELDEVAADRDERLILLLSDDIDSQRVGISIDDVVFVDDYPADSIQSSAVLSDMDSPGIRSGVLAAAVPRESRTEETLGDQRISDTYTSNSESESDADSDAESADDEDSDSESIEELDIRDDRLIGIIDPMTLIDVATEPAES